MLASYADTLDTVFYFVSKHGSMIIPVVVVAIGVVVLTTGVVVTVSVVVAGVADSTFVGNKNYL